MTKTFTKPLNKKAQVYRNYYSTSRTFNGSTCTTFKITISELNCLSYATFTFKMKQLNCLTWLWVPLEIVASVCPSLGSMVSQAHTSLGWIMNVTVPLNNCWATYMKSKILYLLLISIEKIYGKWKCVGALYLLSHFHNHRFGLCPNILFLKSSHWLPIL